MILRAWPTIAKEPGYDIRIVAGAKAHGQQTRDIDLLVFAQLSDGPRYHCTMPFGPARSLPDAVRVSSLCLVIEVKDHAPEDVRFPGTTVEFSIAADIKAAGGSGS